MFPFNFPPLISKFKLLKLLWLVSGCLFQCTQFRILVHQHSIWDLIPLCIWISPLGEYYPSPCACKIRTMLMVCMSSSISPLKSGFFNQFSVQSLDRHIFFSFKFMCLSQNCQQIFSFGVVSVSMSLTLMSKSWEWFGHDFYTIFCNSKQNKFNSF